MPITFQPRPSAAQRHPKSLTSPLFARAWRVLGACIVATWTLATPAQAQAQQRVALVIGNASYQNEATLNNPANDAKLIDNTLRTAPLSFSQVTHVSNVNRVQLLSALSAFKRQAQEAEVALVYYSGHGMINSKRQNHVLPVDMPKISANAGLDADTALEAYGVSEDKLIDAISGAKVQVAVLDACRDNGFGASKSGTKGLSRRNEESKNRLIAYATEEGRTAEDGKAGNSTYAASLAKHLVRTDWPLLKVFDAVTDDVERSTGGQQSPTRSGNLRHDVFLLASVAPVPTGLPVQAQPDAEQEAWELAKRRDTAQSYQIYLNRYPRGRYAETARDALAGLQPAPTPQPQPTQPVQPAQPVMPAAQASSQQTVLQPGQAFKDCSQAHCPEIVVIPGGSFVMGSTAAEQKKAQEANLKKEWTDWEGPQRRVSVRSFAAGRYAVTKGQFAAFVQAKGYRTEAERGDGCLAWKGSELKQEAQRSWRNPGFAQGDDHPVVCVSWNDAQAYTQWLSQSTGKAYRLLSEAEREYAARAGSQTAYWWGDRISTAQANYDGNYSYSGSPKGEYRQATVAVNSFNANPFGLYNVHGNVWEWVQDCFEDNYSAGQPTDGTAHKGNDSTCSRRVLRGGSWGGVPSILRSANRGGITPDFRSSGSGFRIARTVP